MVSQKDSEFKVGRFFNILAQHMLFELLSPLVAIPILLGCWKCNSIPLRNMAHYGFKCHSSTLYGYLLAFVTPAFIVFLMAEHFRGHRENKESIAKQNKVSPFDCLPLLVVLLCRKIMISVKYAYYSEQHMKIIQRTRLSQTIMKFDLMIVAIVDDYIDGIQDRIQFIINSLSLDKDRFYFNIEEKDLFGRDRLLDYEVLRQYHMSPGEEAIIKCIILPPLIKNCKEFS
jgi:hypothetical protein